MSLEWTLMISGSLSLPYIFLAYKIDAVDIHFLFRSRSAPIPLSFIPLAITNTEAVN